MPLDLNFSWDCIGYREPTLWISVVAISILFVASAYIIRRFVQRSFVQVAVTLISFFVSPLLVILLLQPLYSVFHPNSAVCTHFVKFALFVPFALGVGAGIIF